MISSVTDRRMKRSSRGVRSWLRHAKRACICVKVLLTSVKVHAPGASIVGVTVQKMIEKIDYEIILGAKKDKDFGTVILFGMGGIGTEVFKDVAIGLPPLNQTLARRLMEETEVFKMLKGYRGKPPADMKRFKPMFSNGWRKARGSSI